MSFKVNKLNCLQKDDLVWQSTVEFSLCNTSINAVRYSNSELTICLNSFKLI